MPTGPGVTWLVATMSANSPTVIQPFFSTTSFWMSASIDIPPPKLKMPILRNV